MRQGAALRRASQDGQKALGVRVDDIVSETPISAVRKPGSVGKLQRVFEQASALPRSQQRLVEQFVTTLVEQDRRAR